MYVAVIAVIVAQSLVLGNARVFGYGVLVWLGCHLFEPEFRSWTSILPSN